MNCLFLIPFSWFSPPISPPAFLSLISPSVFNASSSLHQIVFYTKLSSTYYQILEPSCLNFCLIPWTLILCLITVFTDWSPGSDPPLNMGAWSSPPCRHLSSLNWVKTGWLFYFRTFSFQKQLVHCRCLSYLWYPLLSYDAWCFLWL